MTHPIDEKNEEWSIFQQKERKKKKDGEDETIKEILYDLSC